VSLAELAAKGFSGQERPSALNTLGATLYRAGRFEYGIRKLEEGIQLRGGASFPQDCVFLAMAHHCLGHHDEARRWLDRLREHKSSTDLAQSWLELEIRLLRSEAEAVILYDPIFPADPFAN
jgi:Tetratricopeptide repeat